MALDLEHKVLLLQDLVELLELLELMDQDSELQALVLVRLEAALELELELLYQHMEQEDLATTSLATALKATLTTVVQASPITRTAMGI